MVAFMKPTEKSPKAWYASLGYGSSTNKKGHNYDHNIVKSSRFLFYLQGKVEESIK